MRIIAIGRTKMLWDSVRLLYSSGHEVPVIITCRAAPEYEKKEKDFEKLASDIGADFINTQNINSTEIVNHIKKARADLAVSVNWVNMIREEICTSLLQKIILNAHAGDLPRYRGNAPVAWAILQGESKIGITIHKMNPLVLDAGPVIVRDYFPLTPHTYIGEVFDFIYSRVPELFLHAINGLESKTIAFIPQNNNPSLALRCYPRRPEDGKINWSLSADYLHRLVRASSEPFAGAFCIYKNQKIIIWRAHVEKGACPYLAIPGQIVSRNKENGTIAIATGNGILVLDQIGFEGQERIQPFKLLKSLRDRLE